MSDGVGLCADGTYPPCNLQSVVVEESAVYGYQERRVPQVGWSAKRRQDEKTSVNSADNHQHQEDHEGVVVMSTYAFVNPECSE